MIFFNKTTTIVLALIFVLAHLQTAEAAAFSQVDSGGLHSVGIKSNGSLWAWGYNSSGQLGDTTTTDRYSPVQVGSDFSWRSVSTGGIHTLAIKADGTLWAWGGVIITGSWAMVPLTIETARCRLHQAVGIASVSRSRHVTVRVR